MKVRTCDLAGDANNWSTFVNRCEEIIAATNNSWLPMAKVGAILATMFFRREFFAVVLL